MLLLLLTSCVLWSTPPERDTATKLRAACDGLTDPTDARHLSIGGAEVVVLRPRDAQLVTAPKGSSMADTLHEAARGERRVAFNGQFQTLATDFRQTRGETWRGNVRIQVPPNGPTHVAPMDFATLDVVGDGDAVSVQIYRGPPRANPTDRRVALGGLFPVLLDGKPTESWFVDGQEEGHRFAAQNQGKMLVATQEQCTVIVSQEKRDEVVLIPQRAQQAADAAGRQTFSEWTADFAAAGFTDAVALDCGISAHLEFSGPERRAEATTLVHMKPSIERSLRYAAVMSW